jgi:uncharacterized protein (DUF952 family)
MIFHIVDKVAWRHAQAVGRYTPESLGKDGFVHASTATQVRDTAERFFAGRDDLLVLCIDEAALGVPLRWELPVTPAGEAAGERFPHIYGPLDVRAVLEARVLRRDSGGNFVWP